MLPPCVVVQGLMSVPPWEITEPRRDWLLAGPLTRIKRATARIERSRRCGNFMRFLQKTRGPSAVALAANGFQNWECSPAAGTNAAAEIEREFGTSRLAAPDTRLHQVAHAENGHDNRPWDSGAASRPCTCGAPGMPCPTCNRDEPPRSLPGFVRGK